MPVRISATVFNILYKAENGRRSQRRADAVSPTAKAVHYHDPHPLAEEFSVVGLPVFPQILKHGQHPNLCLMITAAAHRKSGQKIKRLFPPPRLPVDDPIFLKLIEERLVIEVQLLCRLTPVPTRRTRGFQ